MNRCFAAGLVLMLASAPAWSVSEDCKLLCRECKVGAPVSTEALAGLKNSVLACDLSLEQDFGLAADKSPRTELRSLRDKIVSLSLSITHSNNQPVGSFSAELAKSLQINRLAIANLKWSAIPSAEQKARAGSMPATRAKPLPVPPRSRISAPPALPTRAPVAAETEEISFDEISYKDREYQVPAGLLDSNYACGLNPQKLEQCLEAERSKGVGQSFCNDIMLYAGNLAKMADPNTNPAMLKVLADYQKQYRDDFLEILSPEELLQIKALEGKQFQCGPIEE